MPRGRAFLVRLGYSLLDYIPSRSTTDITTVAIKGHLRSAPSKLPTRSPV